MSMELVKYPPEEHDARVICADPQALAYEWIKAYTKNLNGMIEQDGDEDYGYYSPITMEELIQTAESNISDSTAWGEYITKGGAFEGIGVDPTFWDKLAILREIEIPQNKRNNFFSCSC